MFLTSENKYTVRDVGIGFQVISPGGAHVYTFIRNLIREAQAAAIEYAAWKNKQ